MHLLLPFDNIVASFQSNTSGYCFKFMGLGRMVHHISNHWEWRGYQFKIWLEMCAHLENYHHYHYFGDPQYLFLMIDVHDAWFFFLKKICNDAWYTDMALVLKSYYVLQDTHFSIIHEIVSDTFKSMAYSNYIVIRWLLYVNKNELILLSCIIFCIMLLVI